MSAVATLSPYLRKIDVPAADLRGNHYEIDLGAIRHNYRQLRAHLPERVAVYACLKRNAYGCGAGPVARALASEDVDGFAVASMLDAMAIRREGISNPILLYAGALPVAAGAVKSLNLIVTVSSLSELRQWRAVIENLRVFIKVDLGFYRAGATPAQAIELLAEATADRKVRIEGLYAHMSELPGSGTEDIYRHLKKMKGIIRQIRSMDARVPIIMMSSTEGALNFPDMDFDAVDPGALFVGLSEVEHPLRDVALRPALTEISTSLVSVKRLDSSLRPQAEIPWIRADMTIGVIGMGWGDGLPRHLPNDAVALVRGKRAKLLPPSHLEHIRIDLTDIPEAHFGDQVILLGRQGNEEITLDEVAHHWGTDVMGIYGNLRDHIPRAYI
ncbi:alanine racemase [Agrobacterium rubi]|uniref:alanine racemase n=1 Tax=Agrobacterium rubi TaxID=28099 RepID=UPI001574C848|nr:alanine racemase [Agrobacterium rubi]NTF10676.1 alanine racemase [Agrobacterium rubi]NTF23070.1 alanine racemase [Agrobacterium rubi]NTF30001.1 alanine racemase [Agrobacterium rubi]